LDELSGQNAGLHGLSQAHRIGNQDTAARLSQRLQGGLQLVGFEIHYGAMAEVNLRIVRHGAAALALEVEQYGVEHRTGVSDQLRLGGIEDFNRSFQSGQEQ
jgi:hypothetical protein